ncbi:hypothetical protein BASA61_001475 [Batrachochytrium salamandrivorans]|nr:hypothetical protein BASA60_008019 [Batrachochytrium salamandrivorans]KAH6602106.1 hypothetical protein BASA61_001475 [Batrachochytrium salamandrivorans]KAH9266606.1 hypothetical protein BASA84_001094 [Batrachochytrium salamandrivorans]
MRFLGLSVAVILFFGATTGDAAGCTQPAQRNEWRELTLEQRSSYLSAVVCLKNTPSIIAGIGSPSRYDDFAYAHGQILNIAHMSANFLPWHRAYLYAYELALINECGYPGTLPYWDWSVDSQAPEKSPVWGADAFGGDGDNTTDTRCITNGPFVNFTSTFNQAGCISRTLGESFTDLVSLYTPEVIFQLIAAGSSYVRFCTSLEGGPHNSVHAAVGGTMNLLSVSANDPIFVLHHGNVDRIWYWWQLKNPRLANTYSGVLRDGQRARVSETMKLFGASGLPDWTVAMMLNTTSGDPLCYTYSNSVRAGPPIAIPTSSSTLGTRPTSSALVTRPTSSASGTATTLPTLEEVKGSSLARRDNTASYDACSPQGTMYGTKGQRSGKFSRIRPTCHPKFSLKEMMDAFDAFQFGTLNKITPLCPDRTNSVKLRCPSRVSNSMLERMGMTVEEVIELRQIENSSCSYVNYINSYYPDYQSSVALGRTEGCVEFHPVTNDEAAREHDLYSQMYTQYLNDISKTQPGLQV